ncbi:MAG: hypothetical protein ACMG51_05840 [Ginsengibacter sp.]
MKKAVLYAIDLLLIIMSTTAHAQNSEKKLIEFGWDYPTVEYLKKNIIQMEKTPFDGVVFSLDFKVYNAFDTLRFPDSVFQFYQLTKIPWKKFTDNFIFVRGESLNGAQWLNDKAWDNISENIKNISKAVFASKAKGILFDPEYYIPDSTRNPWTFSSSLYPGLSYEQVGASVKKRGKQFIQSLQTYSPDIKILFTWMLGLVSAQNRLLPIQKTGMALIPFFIEGILDGSNGKSELIDGNEFSYGYMESAHFIWAGERIRNDAKKYIKNNYQSQISKVSIAQAVYFDGIMATSAVFNKGYDSATKKRWLKENLYNALKTTDKYVWFYNEKINWWKNQVDSGISKLITDVKDRINSEFDVMNHSSSISKSFSRYEFRNGNTEVRPGSALYNPSTNILKIYAGTSSFTSIELYKNSRLIFTKEDPPINFEIDLNGTYDRSGNLIIVTKLSNGMIGRVYLN